MKARDLSDADLLTLFGLFARGWVLETEHEADALGVAMAAAGKVEVVA